ncbi:LysE family translocator [Streptomyces sp. NPDC021212]|uniref:LysE family translocator n=1 Tax=Streptomyces sp. NPDC021212 TaxID=3365118 RepID=UPI00379407BC
MFTSALAFAGVAALINVTPGLDTLLVLRTSVAHGRNAGLAASLGILAGCLVWGFATAVGLTALPPASRVAYDTLRVAGAAYLVWLGASARAVAAGGGGGGAGGCGAGGRIDAAGAVGGVPGGGGDQSAQPKAGVFCMRLIPQFTVPRD